MQFDDFETGGANEDIDTLDEILCDSKDQKCNISLSDSILPISKIRNKGFKVSQINANTYKLKANRPTVLAKIHSVGKDFVYKIVSECYDKECELRNEAPKNFWDIEQIGDGIFIIKRN